MRLAGAPISWGVCEVPGWGYQLDPERVLTEMRRVGLTATELGPDGYLGRDPGELRERLESHDLTLVCGFVPALLHDGDSRAGLDDVRRAARLLAAAGADLLVVAAASGEAGYDRRTRLEGRQWDELAEGLHEVRDIAASHGLAAALHPHVGTAIEDADDVRRVLDASAIDLCLDTGHLTVAGADPVVLADDAGDRVRHVHLKDVDGRLAAAVRRGERPYAAAVGSGLYRPLGEGDARVADLVRLLEGAGYAGWYVLEQDAVLTGEPAPGAGPIADVGTSVGFLHQTAGGAGVPGGAARPQVVRVGERQGEERT